MIIKAALALFFAVLALPALAQAPSGLPAFSNSPARDAGVIKVAREINAEWEKTFDKDGKFPPGKDGRSHGNVLATLREIPSGSPSYGAAQELIAKLQARNDELVAADPTLAKPSAPTTFIPNPGLTPKVTLSGLDRSYNVLKRTIVIENFNPFPIADVKLSCSVFAGSGTAIREYSPTIFEIVPAKGRKR